jgi:hypothetical protein
MTEIDDDGFDRARDRVIRGSHVALRQGEALPDLATGAMAASLALAGAVLGRKGVAKWLRAMAREIEAMERGPVQ